MTNFREMPTRVTVKDIVRTALQSQQRTKEWLAGKSGISIDTINRMLAEDLNGKPIISDANRNIIFDTLGITMEAFELHHQKLHQDNSVKNRNSGDTSTTITVSGSNNPVFSNVTVEKDMVLNFGETSTEKE